ncbi:MAG: hypothetical protein QM756_14680 [Polyangiaceae bacterium]
MIPFAAPVRESESTQLYQRVPQDLLRKARHASTPPPPPSSGKGVKQLREDPWAIADERTAVFAPPPELLASVRAAALSAGLNPDDAAPAPPEPEAQTRITAEFPVQAPPVLDEPEVTKVAPPPNVASDPPPLVAAAAPVELASGDDQAEAEEEWRPRRRWPWAVAALLIAAGLAVMALRSQASETRPGKASVSAPR